MEEKEKTAEEKVAMVLAVVKEVEKDMEKLKTNIDELKQYLEQTDAETIVSCEDEPRLNIERGLIHICLQ